MYSIVYADPPWSYSDKGCNGAAAKHYSTMTLADIKALPVSKIAAKDAVLFLWVTNPLLPEALEVMSAWGFRYKTKAFEWVKSRGAKEFFGMGRWTRGNTESCLLGVRGKIRPVSGSVRQLVWDLDMLYDCGDNSCRYTKNKGGMRTNGGCRCEPEIYPQTLGAPVTKHSAKPPEVRQRIVDLMGDLPRIELFAREKTPGWAVFGNQVEDSVDITSLAG